MSNTPEIVIVGSLAIDNISTPHRKCGNLIGGSATYASLAAAKFSSVGVVGVVGDDKAGKKIISSLKNNRIDTKGIEIRRGKTFLWEGRYLSNMNERRTIFLDLGVFAQFKPEIPQNYHKPQILFLANIDPSLQKDVVRKVKAQFYCLDTMDHWIINKKKHILDILPLMDILIVNDGEANLLSEETSLLRAGKFLLSKGAGAVLIKKGEHGSFLLYEKKIFIFPAYPLGFSCDPTGAGDSFAGAFLGYLSHQGFRKENFPRALVYATAVASFCVENFGISRLVELKRIDIERRVKELLKLTQVD